ncbi:hypothetical protein M5D96_004232, partial [Drosophila gunungcola]
MTIAFNFAIRAFIVLCTLAPSESQLWKPYKGTGIQQLETDKQSHSLIHNFGLGNRNMEGSAQSQFQSQSQSRFLPQSPSSSQSLPQIQSELSSLTSGSLSQLQSQLNQLQSKIQSQEDSQPSLNTQSQLQSQIQYGTGQNLVQSPNGTMTFPRERNPPPLVLQPRPKLVKIEEPPYNGNPITPQRKLIQKVSLPHYLIRNQESNPGLLTIDTQSIPKSNFYVLTPLTDMQAQLQSQSQSRSNSQLLGSQLNSQSSAAQSQLQSNSQSSGSQSQFQSQLNSLSQLQSNSQSSG